MTANSDIQFTPDGYVALVQRLRARGYALRGFAASDPAAPHLILRHDVDMSLERAAEMAALEARHGISATYFVLVRSEFYNPAAAASGAALRQILAGGHRIGLHFDAALHPPSAQDEAAAAECALLEALVGTPVEAISFHRPPAADVGGAERIGGRLNAYAARFTRDMGYCSDSRGAWHHGPPLAHPAVAARRALHLLTHPIWWMGAEAAPAERLRSFLERRFAHLDAELARHCSVHRPEGGR
ncbi:MAG TPA: hypothetical protein VIF14_07710 [Alphaproteobacteria bacterium]|jgi:hypothetical protein